MDKKIPGNSLGVVGRKVLFDQLVFSPVNLAACLIAAGIIEASTKREIVKDIREKGSSVVMHINDEFGKSYPHAFIGLHLYMVEWVVWPPAQFFNFYILPTRFRVLYDNVISLGYDMYTSHVKYRDSKLTPPPSESQNLNTDLDSLFLSIKNSKPIWALNLNFDTGDD